MREDTVKQKIVHGTEIESLGARKEGLKAELQTKEEKEKSFQEDMQILKEKIEIRHPEIELKAKLESMKQLESKKSKS